MSITKSEPENATELVQNRIKEFLCQQHQIRGQTPNTNYRLMREVGSDYDRQFYNVQGKGRIVTWSLSSVRRHCKRRKNIFLGHPIAHFVVEFILSLRNFLKLGGIRMEILCFQNIAIDIARLIVQASDSDPMYTMPDVSK